MNLAHEPWKPSDGHGSEELDYKDYKLFNPTMLDVSSLLARVTKEMLDGTETVSVLPKRVKLSDSGMGLIVLLGVTVQKTWLYYPLNFNSAGYAIGGSPGLTHVGHAFQINGVTCQFGPNKGSSFILCGAKGYAQGENLHEIQRPASKSAKKPLSIPGSSPSSSRQIASSPITRRLEVPSPSAIRPVQTSSPTAPAAPRQAAPTISRKAAPAVSGEVHMLGASSARSQRPGRIFPSMTIESPRSSSKPTDDLRQTRAELDASTESLSALIKQHALVVIAVKRLEAAYCRQAEGLLQAKEFMDGALPVLQAVAKGDQKRFQLQKDHLRSTGTLMGFEDAQAGMIMAYNEAKEFRDEVLGDLEHADRSRIFTHSGGLARVKPALLEWYRALLESKDPVEWFTTFHSNYTDDAVIPDKGKGRKNPIDYDDLDV